MSYTAGALDGYGYCLLHGEHHPMGADCWNTVVGYWLEHQEQDPAPTDKQIKQEYDTAVERKMLFNLANGVTA